MKSKIETWLWAWFVKRHGIGEPHQADIYRCTTCGSIVTHRKIREAKICCSGHLSPAQPGWFDIVRLFVFPWSI